jgi:alcohol dehydrogenase
MAELAKAIGIETSGDMEKDRLLLSDALLDLTKKLKIKTLSEQGIEKKDFDMLAEDVLKEPVLGFNPRQGVTKEEVLAILEQAY